MGAVMEWITITTIRKLRTNKKTKGKWEMEKNFWNERILKERNVGRCVRKWRSNKTIHMRSWNCLLNSVLFSSVVMVLLHVYKISFLFCAFIHLLFCLNYQISDQIVTMPDVMYMYGTVMVHCSIWNMKYEYLTWIHSNNQKFPLKIWHLTWWLIQNISILCAIGWYWKWN